ncbi:alpha/beta hydrolase [Gordonibacter sp. An230]|uniref:alpha/beta fold hydrolase n=1 Tax=Gordonibacter sp. An230 TaxID=1965592 RepID=UPI000B396A65|nr:alpha/beta fold hydrolase [Gordonibacter sp. An230]OUO88314.1 alpha/beta hydrolase [Gordonibacter sp. An230]
MVAAGPDSARSEVEYPSVDGTTHVKGLIWRLSEAASDTVPPRGIVQIVHGMSEHVARYDEFARCLARRGFVVCGEDHVGHGRTAATADDLGHIPLEGGKDLLIANVHALRLLVAARFAPQTPYFLFGHSMGSFIVRAYLARHAAGLAGAVICGTGQQPRALSAAGNLLARLIARAKGERHRSTLIDRMGAGSFGRRIKGARTPFDWLSVDPAVVDAYLSDELCGAMFTVGGYAALTDLTGEVAAPSCAARVPRDLPLLFIAGAEDPVGDEGRGVRAAAALMRRAGVESVEEVVYEGMRHEILNEPGRDQVIEDVACWLKAHAPGCGAAPGRACAPFAQDDHADAPLVDAAASGAAAASFGRPAPVGRGAASRGKDRL